MEPRYPAPPPSSPSRPLRLPWYTPCPQPLSPPVAADLGATRDSCSAGRKLEERIANIFPSTFKKSKEKNLQGKEGGQ